MTLIQPPRTSTFQECDLLFFPTPYLVLFNFIFWGDCGINKSTNTHGCIFFGKISKKSFSFTLHLGYKRIALMREIRDLKISFLTM